MKKYDGRNFSRRKKTILLVNCSPLSKFSTHRKFNFCLLDCSRNDVENRRIKSEKRHPSNVRGAGRAPQWRGGEVARDQASNRNRECYPRAFERTRQRAKCWRSRRSLS